MGVIDRVFTRFERELKGKAVRDRPLAKHTTLRVGGPAGIFVTADSLNELRLVLQTALDFGLPYFVLGKGSNVLVSDEGFDGIVIELGIDFRKIVVDGGYIQAGAGVALPVLVQVACKRGLEGLAFAVGIPGSLGGALVMNAGAYRRTIGDVVRKVTVYTLDHQLRSLDRSEIAFGYRSSSLPADGIIVEAVIKLRESDPDCVAGEMEKLFRKRKRTQPLNLPSAGSVFKNPPGLFAGKLIEEVGCKGLRVGDAQISQKHANFVVNLGNAIANDVLTLLKKVQDEVYSGKGIILEPEITLVGEFPPSLIPRGRAGEDCEVDRVG